MGLRLTWKDSNVFEEEHRIYRSDTPMDPQNLPAPLDTVGPDVTAYIDATVAKEQTYYYRVGAVTASGTAERVSEELEVFTSSQAPGYFFLNGETVYD